MIAFNQPHTTYGKLGALQFRLRQPRSPVGLVRPVHAEWPKQADASQPPPGEQPIETTPAKTEENSGGLGKLLLLGLMFAGWYAFNIVFNINNKQVLTAFHYPLTCTSYQFLLGSIFGLGWFAASGTRIDTSKSTLVAVLPLAVVHTLGNLLTNVSLGMVAVSFTHTIKALEPLFSVLFSILFLGDTPNPIVLLTLLPIMGGVIGASLTEASFNWPGFASAMMSNVTFQSRNVFSKKFMTPDIKERVGGSIGLFSLMTMMSLFLLAPVALLVEGPVFLPSHVATLGVKDPSALLQSATIAAATFHLYQQVSYMILARVSPVTHSIGNCVKRVIVIVASVIVFKNPMSTQTMISTMVALAGVFAYSQAKRLTGKPAK
eukprot:jgi/Ulvmu1/7438/UM036_0099.1